MGINQIIEVFGRWDLKYLKCWLSGSKPIGQHYDSCGEAWLLLLVCYRITITCNMAGGAGGAGHIYPSGEPLFVGFLLLVLKLFSVTSCFPYLQVLFFIYIISNIRFAELYLWIDLVSFFHVLVIYFYFDVFELSHFSRFCSKSFLIVNASINTLFR